MTQARVWLAYWCRNIIHIMQKHYELVETVKTLAVAHEKI